MSNDDSHQVGSLGTEVSSAGAQDAQGFKILNAGRSAGSALHRSAGGDRHSAFGRGDGRPFGDYRARRARYRLPHRKVCSDTGVKAAAFVIIWAFHAAGADAPEEIGNKWRAPLASRRD